LGSEGGADRGIRNVQSVCYLAASAAVINSTVSYIVSPPNGPVFTKFVVELPVTKGCEVI